MHTSRLTRTLQLGQPPRPGGQAGADHGGQQLRGDADRDRQREQHRIDHRAAQQQVGHQDQHGQRQRHLQQQIGEPAQPDLEVGLGLTLAQTGGDPAELRRSDRWRTPPRSRSPALTTVPMKARSAASASVGTGGPGSADFSDGRRLAGQDALVALQAVDRRSAARRRAPVRPASVRMTSPGTSSLTSILTKWPSRRTTAVWRTRECSAALARSARYSLTKPRPMLTARMTPMMIAWVAVAEEERHHGGDRQQDQHGVVELAAQHRPGADPMGAKRIRARSRARRADMPHSAVTSPSVRGVAASRQHVGRAARRRQRLRRSVCGHRAIAVTAPRRFEQQATLGGRDVAPRRSAPRRG